MSVLCRKVGNSIAATIPNDIVKLVGIRPGDSMEISSDGRSITLTPKQKRLRGEIFLEKYFGKPLSEIGQIETETVDWGAPAGEEEW